ncbi:hypothetical protein SSS_10142 [Sarcoptes scabiei]|nr:hypothetical protein SSS_10142 [Sarcoptes scabiei]
MEHHFRYSHGSLGFAYFSNYYCVWSNMDQTNQQPDRCKRCDHNNFGFVRLQKKDIYCRQCLQDYCIHRFRSTVGKSHQIKYDENVLVAVSGGWSSLALADMVFKGRIIESDQHRKIKYMPSFLHLDGR